jgi:small subunit ribosomal protein S4
MILGAKFKICRRLGSGVYDKCQSQKYMLSEARHEKSKNSNNKRRKQVTDFGLQLIAKQRVRFTYGVTEKQFVNYVRKAEAVTGMKSSDKLAELLEGRLDNVVYRLGFASSRRHARQMVSHGHFLVNNKRSKVPSQQINSGDVISIREGSQSSVLFQDIAKKTSNIPNWLSFDAKTGFAKLSGRPKTDDPFLDFNTVMEFYSR